MAGWVRVNGVTVRKPAHLLKGGEDIAVERPGGVYVGRGGDKLAFALDFFGIDLSGLTVADLGASTGGFTHCMLLRGARKIYAVDVGYGQLDYRLRGDPAVRVMERTHVRDLTQGHFDDRIDFVTADLSFISLLRVFDSMRNQFPGAGGLLLVKPQFEAYPGEQKRGVVRSAESHTAILKRVVPALAEKGMELKGLCRSPLKGPAGNLEFFIWCSFHDSLRPVPDGLDSLVARVVNEAHAAFQDSQ